MTGKQPIVMQEVHGSAWVNHQPTILAALRAAGGRAPRQQLADACGVTPNASAFTRALRKLTERGAIRKTGGGKGERGRQEPIAYEIGDAT